MSDVQQPKQEDHRGWRRVLKAATGKEWTFEGSDHSFNTGDGRWSGYTNGSYLSTPISKSASIDLAGRLAEFGISAIERDSGNGNVRIEITKSQLDAHGAKVAAAAASERERA